MESVCSLRASLPGSFQTSQPRISRMVADYMPSNPHRNVGGSRISNKISGRISQTAKILTADDADLRRYGIQTRIPESKGGIIRTIDHPCLWFYPDRICEICGCDPENQPTMSASLIRPIRSFRREGAATACPRGQVESSRMLNEQSATNVNPIE
jgi:hypothetical protein